MFEKRQIVDTVCRFLDGRTLPLDTPLMNHQVRSAWVAALVHWLHEMGLDQTSGDPLSLRSQFDAHPLRVSQTQQRVLAFSRVREDDFILIQVWWIDDDFGQRVDLHVTSAPKSIIFNKHGGLVGRDWYVHSLPPDVAFSVMEHVFLNGVNDHMIAGSLTE